ncbi:MAG: Holliday junction resolvase RuvX [Tepidisphaeraceae bacterium]|jgi:putative Holliday junction resolvase
MRTLGIDPGSRRVGLSLSDAAGKLATPYGVLHVRFDSQAVEQILKIIETEAVQRLVIGLALNMDGTRGAAAQGALDLGRELAARSGKPVIFVDERLSTFQAERNLVDRKRSGEKITRKQKKARLDAQAAVVFLQEYLDAKLAALNPR